MNKKKQQPKNVTRSFLIDPDENKELEDVAWRQRTDCSKVLRELVRRFLEENRQEL